MKRCYRFCRTKSELVQFIAGYRKTPPRVLMRLRIQVLRAIMAEVIHQHEAGDIPRNRIIRELNQI